MKAFLHQIILIKNFWFASKCKFIFFNEILTYWSIFLIAAISVDLILTRMMANGQAQRYSLFALWQDAGHNMIVR